MVYPECIQSAQRVNGVPNCASRMYPRCIQCVARMYPRCYGFSVMYPLCIHSVSMMYSWCIPSVPRPFVSSWRIQDASTVYPHFAEGAPNVCSVCIWGLAQRVSIVYSARIQLKRCSVRLWRPALGLFITQSARRLQAARVLRFQAECSRASGRLRAHPCAQVERMCIQPVGIQGVSSAYPSRIQLAPSSRPWGPALRCPACAQSASSVCAGRAFPRQGALLAVRFLSVSSVYPGCIHGVSSGKHRLSSAHPAFIIHGAASVTHYQSDPSLYRVRGGCKQRAF